LSSIRKARDAVFTLTRRVYSELYVIMGELADRLDRVVVRETSPDGRIIATQVHRNQITLQFLPGAYWRYDESMLEGQLTALARAVRSSCQRTFYETVSEVTGLSVTAAEAERELDGHDRRFREAQRELQVRAGSPGDWITVEIQGLDRWHIRIKKGALRRLSEERFVAEAMAVLGELLAAYRDRDRELREEFFDLKPPKRPE
jgi:hypothetical protein